MSVDTTYKEWLYANKNTRYARYIWLRSPSIVNLIFTENFVSRTNDRNKQDDLRTMGNLCRFHDIKFDTDLHEKFTSWIKKKEIKWNSTTYKLPKEQLSINHVLDNITKLEPLYSDFALFMLTSGLRTIEARTVFENHKKFCHDGTIEIFWHRKTKNANATFCHPLLHDKMDKDLKFDYDHFKKLECELRFLRKLNYTIVATKIDPLLANFMQGRTGDVSQRHYFLPMMSQHRKKWIKIWHTMLNNIT
nr:integrase [Candidatus Nitrosarchaeum limnium]